MAILPFDGYVFPLSLPFGFGNGSNLRPLVTGASSLVLPKNYRRCYLSLYNNSGVQMYFRFGEAAVVNQGVRLAPNEFFELRGSRIWMGAIYMIAASGSNAVDIFEGTF